MIVNGEAKKTITRGMYTAFGGFIVVMAANAFSLYNQSQVFKDTTTKFIEAQSNRNEKQDVSNEQFRIAIAELKQQSQDQSRRLDLIENRMR